MAIDPALAQEGTETFAGDTRVTEAIEAVGACRAVTDVLSRVGDKWSMQVVMKLGEEARRFNDLRRAVDGISQRMLTRTLRNLERDGLVLRTVTPTNPPRVDYALTPMGQSLRGPVEQLSAWVLAHHGQIDAARLEYDLREEN